MVSLDGSTRYIETDFIKLLNTGTANLATESYVDTAVANGGGGGVLTNYYTQTQVDNTLTNYYTETETDI